MKRATIISTLVLIPVIMLLAIFAIMNAGEQKVMAAVTGPCDIYASGGTPCVSHTLPPMTDRAPILTRPRIVAPL